MERSSKSESTGKRANHGPFLLGCGNATDLHPYGGGERAVDREAVGAVAHRDAHPRLVVAHDCPSAGPERST